MNFPSYCSASHCFVLHDGATAVLLQSLLTTIQQHADGMDPSMRRQLHMSMYRISISALHHYNPQAPPIPSSYANNPREQRADRATAHLLLSGFLPEVSGTSPV